MATRHFKEFTDKHQAEYQKYAEEHWDANLVRQSNSRWNSLDAAGRKALLTEGEHITLAIVDSMASGVESQETQSLIADWHAYINRFYDCSIEIFGELGKMYLENPQFADFYRGINPELPEFLSEAMGIYCTKRAAEV